MISVVFFRALFAVGIYNLTAAQESAIAPIANLCPLEGGKAVSLARSLYGLKYHVVYDDESLCAKSKSLQATGNPEKRAETIAGIHIYPNPATESALVSWPSPQMSGQMVNFSLLSLDGKVLHAVEVDAEVGQLTLQLRGYQAGIYVCRIQIGEGTIESRKLVIVR